MAAPSLGDPAGIVPLDQFLPELQKVLDGVDVRAAQPRLDCAGECELKWSFQGH